MKGYDLNNLSMFIFVTEKILFCWIENHYLIEKPVLNETKCSCLIPSCSWKVDWQSKIQISRF